MKEKSFFISLLIWAFLGGLGFHRLYINGKLITLLWYWAANMCTFGVLWVVDLFLIKGMIENEKLKSIIEEQKEEEKLKKYTKEYYDNKEIDKEVKKIGF